MTQRYFLKFSYKGTNYSGWQIQENATTVQEILNKALSLLLRESIDTIGAGRTDTGVHAKEMFCHFDILERNFDKDELIYHLNKILPKDIAVQDLIIANTDAHARFSALSRTYNYIITKEKDPFLIDAAFFYSKKLNVELMNEASKILFEYIDFSCFSKSHTQVKTNDCRIYEALWKQKGEVLQFTIKADRFLRNMVRAIVGTMLEVGEEKISLENFKSIIESKNRSKAGVSVPPQGLYLVKVEYPSDIFIL